MPPSNWNHQEEIMAPTIKGSVALAACLLTPTVALGKPFVQLPPQHSESSTLQIRVVRYAGGSNGGMTVDIRNVGKRPQRFVAEGLFFVPDGNPAAKS